MHPTRELLNEKKLAEALWECLKDNDSEAFIEILEGYFLAVSTTRGKLAKKAKLLKTTLYHSFKSKNPTLKTLCSTVSTLTAKKK